MGNNNSNVNNVYIGQQTVKIVVHKEQVQDQLHKNISICEQFSTLIKENMYMLVRILETQYRLVDVLVGYGVLTTEQAIVVQDEDAFNNC